MESKEEMRKDSLERDLAEERCEWKMKREDGEYKRGGLQRWEEGTKTNNAKDSCEMA